MADHKKCILCKSTVPENSTTQHFKKHHVGYSDLFVHDGKGNYTNVLDHTNSLPSCYYKPTEADFKTARVVQKAGSRYIAKLDLEKLYNAPKNATGYGSVMTDKLWEYIMESVSGLLGSNLVIDDELFLAELFRYLMLTDGTDKVGNHGSVYLTPLVDENLEGETDTPLNTSPVCVPWSVIISTMAQACDEQSFDYSSRKVLRKFGTEIYNSIVKGTLFADENKVGTTQSNKYGIEPMLWYTASSAFPFIKPSHTWSNAERAAFKAKNANTTMTIEGDEYGNYKPAVVLNKQTAPPMPTVIAEESTYNSLREKTYHTANKYNNTEAYVDASYRHDDD